MSHAPLRRLGAPILAAVMIAATLAACSGPAQEPSSDAATYTRPDPTRSPSPSASATEVEKPERPAAMEKKDAEGAAAAAEYFVELYPYVMRTGDVAEWLSMAHRTCESCSDMITQAVEIKSAKAHAAGGQTSLNVLDEYPRDASTGIYPMDVVIAQGAFQITDGKGNPVLDSDPSNVQRRMEMGRVDGSWVVVEIAPIPDGD